MKINHEPIKRLDFILTLFKSPHFGTGSSQNAGFWIKLE